MAEPMPHPDLVPDERLAQFNVTREQYTALRERRIERAKATPPVGSPAPDFELRRLAAGGSGELTGERVRLSDHLGKPVALVFGSYT